MVEDPTTANAAAYLPPGAAALAISLPLGPLGAVVGAGAAVAGILAYGSHALVAGRKVAELMDQPNERGETRERFRKVGEPDSLKAALKNEMAAEVLGRTGPRMLVTGSMSAARMALTAGHAASAAATLGFVAGPVGWIIGPPSNGLMNMLSVKFKGKNFGRTMAPMAGIAVSKDGICFDDERLQRNLERIDKPLLRSAGASCKRLFRLYRKHFGEKFRQERKIGLTPEKVVETICGGNFLSAVGASAMAAPELAAGAAAGASEKAVRAGTGLVNTALGLSNVATRGAVQGQLAKRGFWSTPFAVLNPMRTLGRGLRDVARRWRGKDEPLLEAGSGVGASTAEEAVAAPPCAPTPTPGPSHYMHYVAASGAQSTLDYRQRRQHPGPICRKAARTPVREEGRRRGSPTAS